MTHADVRAVIAAIHQARIAGRRAIGVQTDNVDTGVIDWVIASHPPLERGCFRLIFDRGPSETHSFPNRLSRS